MDGLARRRATDLSGGQQQRLQLAMALVVDPTLLALDEPTVGLDIEARRDFWRTLQARRDRGVAVLLTTHQLEEAATVADRVVVVNHGRVVASDHPAALTAMLPDRLISAHTGLDDATLWALPGVADVTSDAGRAHLTSTAPETTVRHLLDADPALSGLRVEGARLEQAVMALTTQQHREVAA
jgi:ABC-2 type transport system ATP-binding protein